MALLEDINNIISKTKLFLYLKIIGDATSDFVIYHFQAKRFRNHSRYKLQTWHHLSPHQCEGHKEVAYLIVRSQLKIDCLKLHFLI